MVCAQVIKNESKWEWKHPYVLNKYYLVLKLRANDEEALSSKFYICEVGVQDQNEPAPNRQTMKDGW
jgi:hypothetical protein